MSLAPPTLANDMAQAIGQGAASPQLIGEATAICTELMTPALVMHPPGSIMGNAPPSGGPLPDGEALPQGKILGMAGASLAAAMQANMGFPSITPQVMAMANAITGHIMAAGLVSFKKTQIQGICSNSPVSPGALTGLISTGGTVSGLDGSAMAQMMAPAFGGPASPELEKKCKAIVKHIQESGIVTYPPGSVSGVCSAGGGPVAMGAGVGGKIT